MRTLTLVTALVQAASGQQTIDDLFQRPRPPAAPRAAPKSAPDIPTTGAPGTPSSSEQAPRGWIRHTDPGGFAVVLPTSWKTAATVDPNSGLPLFRFQGPDPRLFAFVMPVRISEPDLRSWFAAHVRRQFAAVFPSVSSASPQLVQGRAGAILSAVRFDTRAGAGQGAILVYRVGKMAMAYGIGAPAGEFTQARPALVRVLSSFRFVAPRQTSLGKTNRSAPALTYATFQDPTEGAYTVQVPQGWKVNGGVQRNFGPTYPLPYLQIHSPGGQITVVAGDPTVPPFVEPQSVGGMFRPGQMYSPGYGSRMMVMAYHHGLAYAGIYLERMVGRTVTGIRIRDRRDRADMVAPFNQSQQTNALAQTQATAGEISFEGQRAGSPTLGYLYCSTTKTEMRQISAGGMWYVTGLYYWLAPPGQESTALAVIAQLVRTFRTSERWYYANQKQVAQTSRIVSETSDRISQVISDSYWSRQKTMDRNSRNFSDRIRDVQRVRDPGTGEEFEARSGSNYYWRLQGDDRPIGTGSTGIETVLDVRPPERID
ncbi:MAG: hypothetical protein R2762_27235 [Bryobacteraceae bacterium]